jgi:hypothetical protein
MKKLTVVTAKNGEVVATRLGHGSRSDPKTGIHSRLVAGPGQTLKEIEIDVPKVFKSPEEVTRFHDSVKKHLAK